MKLIWFTLVLYYLTQANASVQYNSSNFQFNIEISNKRASYSVTKFGRILQRVYLDDEFKRNYSLSKSDNGFTVHGDGRHIDFRILEDSANFTLLKVSRVLPATQNSSDCFDLVTGDLHWYGGPQVDKQYFPIEKSQFEDLPLVSKLKYNAVVPERYWLHSKGAFIYVDDKAPLFLNQNIRGNTICFIVKNELPYNTRRTTIQFVYYLGFAADAKQAQRRAVKHFLQKPTGIPDLKMVEHPIWSTWAKYKRDVNESVVEEYASKIQELGFNNSQIEIDDDWEVCYGALTFRQSKFPNIRKQTDSLRARGFRVTLWIHPFIDKDCEPWFSEAKNKGYLVEDHVNNTDIVWWNREDGQAAHIDFTKSEAAAWFTDRLKKLQDMAGIDSLKFDAGETVYFPTDPKLNASIEEHPIALTKTYLRTVSQFGPMIEFRSGQGTQDLPNWLRMLDKYTNWNYDRGVPTLVTTLLQMNINGYNFVLPDMIGGNGYNNTYPSAEMFLRWLQANTLMPSIQFSYTPWDFGPRLIDISKKFLKIHAQFTPEITKAFKKAVSDGEPVNPPIWWLDPNDKVALGIGDEFLLGDSILSAPVLTEGAVSRDIYLPKGKWYDPHFNTTQTGPKWLRDYPAPLSELPYFILQN